MNAYRLIVFLTALLAESTLLSNGSITNTWSPSRGSGVESDFTPEEKGNMSSHFYDTAFNEIWSSEQKANENYAYYHKLLNELRVENPTGEDV